MLNMFGGYSGLFSFGLKAIGMLGGSNEDDARYRHEMAKYKRALMMQKAGRAWKKQSYAAALDANLDSASTAYKSTMNEFWDGYGEFQLKQAAIYAKASSVKGSMAASGKVGGSAKRVENMTIANHLAKGKRLAEGQKIIASRVNAKTDAIWTQYKNANQKAYDKSGLGLPVSAPGGMPTRTKSNKGLFGILGLAGDTIAGNLGKNPLSNPMEDQMSPMNYFSSTANEDMFKDQSWSLGDTDFSSILNSKTGF